MLNTATKHMVNSSLNKGHKRWGDPKRYQNGYSIGTERQLDCEINEYLYWYTRGRP